MTVVNLEDYRAPKPEPKPCTVTFMGFPFVTPEGISNHVNVTVPAEDGDYLRIMEVIRELGGIGAQAKMEQKRSFRGPARPSA